MRYYRGCRLLSLVTVTLYFCLTISFSQTSSSSDQALILEQADRMSGSRGQGEIVVEGSVRFRHGDLLLMTERAIWTQNQRLIQCEQGLRVEHRKATLTGDYGSYSRPNNMAIARGNVMVVDSSGDLQLTGGRLVYDRLKQMVEVFEKPILKRFYSDSLLDTNLNVLPNKKINTAKMGDSKLDIKPKKRYIDTLTILAEQFIYNDSSDIAHAFRKVDIRKGNLHIVCDTAIYLQRDSMMVLTGSPKADMGETRASGERIYAFFSGEEMKGLQVAGKAKLNFSESGTDSTSEKKSRLSGDSLIIAMNGSKVDSMEVYGQAYAESHELRFPERSNEIKGNFMRLHFDQGRMKSAWVSGKASSTYYHYDKGKYAGRNSSEGDTVTMAFEKGKVADIIIRGDAHGTFITANIDTGDSEDREKAHAD